MVCAHGKYDAVNIPHFIRMGTLIAAMLIWANAACQNGRDALTNIQFVKHAADSVFRELAGELIIEKNRPVILKTGSIAEPVYNLLVQRFEHILVNSGFSLRESTGLSAGTEITVIPADLLLRYDRIRRNGLFRGTMVHRSLEFSLYLQLRDLPDGRVHTSLEKTVTAESWFPEGKIGIIEKNRYGLRAVDYPEQSLSGWAEFGIYLLTFTALSYLLYSVRSQ